MDEGLATQLHPGINMWETAGPFVSEWMRDELGPEAALAEALRDGLGLVRRLPALIARIEEEHPPKGGAPEAPPLPHIPLMWEDGEQIPNHWARYVATFLVGGVVAWAVLELLGQRV